MKHTIIVVKNCEIRHLYIFRNERTKTEKTDELKSLGFELMTSEVVENGTKDYFKHIDSCDCC